jgi:hypothetical protein
MGGLYNEPRLGAPRQIGDGEVAIGDPQDARNTPPLEPADKGESDGPCALDDPSNLACVLSPTASIRDVQTVVRSAFRGEGARHRRALSRRPERAVVLCVDEKSQIQALDRQLDLR